jgi:hypothetical protein
MAIYHLTTKTVSRGGSVSAAVRSDYIDRSGRYRNDEAEVLYKSHGHMPAWAENCPRNYWEAADTHERANGRLFKQIEFALPKELSPQQQTELAASFCADMALTKDGPLPYSFAVHKGRDEANPHCHLLISERVNDGHYREPDLWFKRAAKDPINGGAKKTNELRPREWLIQCRELWAERANLALQRAGHGARIDHRTLEAQGINRAPTIHLGPSVAAVERRGIRTPRGSRFTRAPIFPQAEKHPTPLTPETKESVSIPAPPPTSDECRDILLAIAKQGPRVMEKYYLEQIKPYMDYFSEAEDKAAAFVFCQERMQADMTTEAPRLKEMRREIDEKLRRMGGTGTMQVEMRQQALDHIRTAPDREVAFGEVIKGIDMALKLSRSRGLAR